MPNYDLMTQADYELYINMLDRAEMKLGARPDKPEAIKNIALIREMKEQVFRGYFGAQI